MQSFISAVIGTDNPVRPLLYAAAAAASVYFYMRMRADKKQTEEPAGTTPSQDAVQTESVDSPSLDPSSVSDAAGASGAQTNSAAPESETEQVYNQVLEINAELEKKNSYLMSKVNNLQEELSLMRIRCNDILMERAQEMEDHTALKKKYEQVMESNVQLENEKSALMSQVDKLQGSLLLKTAEVEETCSIQRNIIAMVMSTAEKQEKVLQEEKEALEASLVETRMTYETTLEEKTRLEQDQENLLSVLNSLEDSVQRLEAELSHSTIRCNAITRECEQKDRALRNLEAKWNIMNVTVHEEYEEQIEANIRLRSQIDELQKEREEQIEAHSRLRSQYDELLKECEQKRVLQAEATASIDQLRNENSDLVFQEREEQIEVHSRLRSQDDDLLKEREEQIEAHSRLRSQYDELLKECEQKLVLQAEATVSVDQLRNENSDLVFQVNTLRSTMRQLKEELCEARRKCVEQRVDGQKNHTFLNLPFKQMISTQDHNLLRVSLAEAEQNLMIALTSNATLVQDLYGLKTHVNVLRDSVKELEEMVADAERKCDVMRQEKQQVMEAHNILEMKNKIMKNKLERCNKLLMSNSKNPGSEDDVAL